MKVVCKCDENMSSELNNSTRFLLLRVFDCKPGILDSCTTGLSRQSLSTQPQGGMVCAYKGTWFFRYNTCPSNEFARHAAMSGVTMSESSLIVGIDRSESSGGLFSDCAISATFVAFGTDDLRTLEACDRPRWGGCSQRASSITIFESLRPSRGAKRG